VSTIDKGKHEKISSNKKENGEKQDKICFVRKNEKHKQKLKHKHFQNNNENKFFLVKL